MRSWFKHWPRVIVTLLPLAVALLHVTGGIHLPVIDRLEASVYDTRLKAFMPRTLDDRVVIIDIDEKSLATIGHWPWSRQQMAELVNVLFEQQDIAVLGMDVVFAEPDTSSGLSQLQALARNELRGETGFTQRLDTLARQLDYDQLFADALHDRPVVLGYYFTSDRQGFQSGVLPEPVLDSRALQGRHLPATEWDGYGSNLEKIARAAPLAGFFNLIVDPDGRVRSVPLLAQHEGRYYESLALGIFRAWAGLPRISLGFATDRWTAPETRPVLDSIRLEQDNRAMSIPVDTQVATLVPYRGYGGAGGGSYRYISAVDVLKGRLAPGSLKHKIVLLGATAPGLLDLRSTPVGAAYPGIEIHANMLSGLLDNTMRVRPDFSVGYDVVTLVLSGLLLALVLPRLSALWSVLLTTVVGGSLVALNLWSYLRLGWVLPLAPSMLMLTLIFVLNMSYGYFIERRAKRKLASLFGAYVPPELVDEMVQRPGRYGMQAVDKELTVMFSDMRGFTELAETLTPQQLQQLLNRVFNQLTHLIRSHRGTIDKYMGDCVMAFWGAPVDTPEHARLAVQTALEMRQAIRDINAAHRHQGIPPIAMGMGLNTGSMCVGDMGSDLRRSYTVIGDAVNLGSRLEGLSKHYGVDIVASGATRAQAQEGFIWQELDTVKVKGKTEAVSIHTVLGTADSAGNEWRDELQHWGICLQAFRAQDWARAQAALQTLLQLRPDKALYHLYQQRLVARQGQPFDPAWDGSTPLETK